MYRMPRYTKAGRGNGKIARNPTRSRKSTRKAKSHGDEFEASQPEAPIRKRAPTAELADEQSVGSYTTTSVSDEPDDVAKGVKIVGRPTLRQEERWSERGGARFISSESGLADTAWIGKRPLGVGTFGIAGLWEKLDRDGGVIDLKFPRRSVPTMLSIVLANGD